MKIRKVDYFEFDEICWKSLTPIQERIYRFLLRCKNINHDFCFPGQNLIAEKAGVNIKTVQRSIKVLEEKEFLVVEKMKAIIGNYNRYKLLIIPCQEGIYERMKSRKKDDKNGGDSKQKSEIISGKCTNMNIENNKTNIQNDLLNFDVCDNINNLEIKNEAKVECDESLFSDSEDVKVKDSNINKLLLFTKIKTITEKQKASLREFDTLTINQTIARIKSGITKMPRTATLLIDKVCDVAIGLGKFKQWQYRKYGILKPVLATENSAILAIEDTKVSEQKMINKYEGYEDILGWYD